MRCTTPIQSGKPASARPPPATDACRGRKLAVYFGLSRRQQLELAGLLCWFATTSASAQKYESPVFVASLSASAIPREFILNRGRGQPDRQALHLTGRTDWSIAAFRSKRTDAEAWNTFQSEYRPANRSSSSVTRSIENTKYGLDAAVFALDRFVRSIDYEIDPGHPQRTRTNSRPRFFDNPRVKLDLDLTHGAPYIGARLVIAFGH